VFQQAETARRLPGFDGDTAGFTICEIGPETAIVVKSGECASALQVIRGTLYLRDERGACLVASAGRVVLVPAGTYLRAASCVRAARHERAPEIASNCGWRVANATGGERCDVLLAGARLDGIADFPLDRAAVTAINRDSAGRRAFSILREEIERRTPGAATFAATLMSACIALALRDAVAESARLAASNPAIERVAAIVRSQPAKPWCTTSLAALAGMSRATFARQFGATMRTTPMQFVLRARLDKAASILRATGLPIKAVAGRSGFASRSHFSRAFSSAFGCDPSAFRDESRAD
jgi:AraC family transcriptional activator of mtrCDE